MPATPPATTTPRRPQATGVAVADRAMARSYGRYRPGPADLPPAVPSNDETGDQPRPARQQVEATAVAAGDAIDDGQPRPVPLTSLRARSSRVKGRFKRSTSAAGIPSAVAHFENAGGGFA